MAGEVSRRFGRGRRGHGSVAAAEALFALCLIFLSSLMIFARGRLKPALRKTTLCCVAAGLVFAPLPAAFTQSPLALYAVETGQIGQETAEHGHSHEEDGGHEHPAGHMHGHDPADHSHQFALLSGGGGQWGLPSARRLPPSPSGVADQATDLGIERPPKQAMSL